METTLLWEVETGLFCVVLATLPVAWMLGRFMDRTLKSAAPVTLEDDESCQCKLTMEELIAQLPA